MYYTLRVCNVRVVCNTIIIFVYEYNIILYTCARIWYTNVLHAHIYIMLFCSGVTCWFRCRARVNNNILRRRQCFDSRNYGRKFMRIHIRSIRILSAVHVYLCTDAYIYIYVLLAATRVYIYRARACVCVMYDTHNMRVRPWPFMRFRSRVAGRRFFVLLRFREKRDFPYLYKFIHFFFYFLFSTSCVHTRARTYTVYFAFDAFSHVDPNPRTCAATGAKNIFIFAWREKIVYLRDYYYWPTFETHHVPFPSRSGFV